MLSKPKPTESMGSSSGGFPDQGFEESYPTLYSYLCDASYESGEPRKTATITMFCDAGYLKACVNDRDNDRSAFVTSETMEGLLDSLEACLSDAKTVWKLPRDSGAGGGQKKARKS